MTQTFKVNQQTELFARFPDLALSIIHVNMKGMQCCVTDCGEANLKQQGLYGWEYLHDQSGALKEAQEWFSQLDLTETKVLYVVGIGMGYAFDAAQHWLKEDPQRHLIFIDDDPRAYSILFNSERGEMLLASKQTAYYCYQGESEIQILGNFLSTFFSVAPIQVSALPYCKRYRAQQFELVRQYIYIATTIEHGTTHEIISEFAMPFYANFFNNLWKIPGKYEGVFSKKSLENIPAIICCGGPSLNEALPFIQKWRSKALLCAGGSSVQKMSRGAALPHLIFTVDPCHAEFQREYDSSCFEVPHCFNTRVNSQVLRVVHANKIYVSSEGAYPIIADAEATLNLSSNHEAGGIFSTTHCMEVARRMGCNPIIFVGMDLAYNKETTVVDNPWKNPETSLLKEPCLLSDQDNKDVYSCWEWVFGGKWLGDYIAAHPECTFINSSTKGLNIKNVQNATLQEIDTLLSSRQNDIDARVHVAIQELPKIKTTMEDIFKYMLTLKNTYYRCFHLCMQIQNLIQDRIPKEGEALLDDKIEGMISDLKKEKAYTVSLRHSEFHFDKYFKLEMHSVMHNASASPAQRCDTYLELLRSKYLFLMANAELHQEIIEDTLKLYGSTC